MFANLTSGLEFQSNALILRAERQRVIASNIANADTPGFGARELDFKEAMKNAIGAGMGPGMRQPQGSAMTHSRHMPLGGVSAGGTPALAYAVQTQPSVDGNSVDLDRERANFVDNSVRYEATLRFINGSAKTLLSAIQGQ